MLYFSCSFCYSHAWGTSHLSTRLYRATNFSERLKQLDIFSKHISIQLMFSMSLSLKLIDSLIDFLFLCFGIILGQPLAGSILGLFRSKHKHDYKQTVRWYDHRYLNFCLGGNNEEEKNKGIYWFLQKHSFCQCCELCRT